MASQARLDYVARLQAVLVQENRDLLPPDIYKKLAKKTPVSIAGILSEGPIDDEVNLPVDEVAPKKTAKINTVNTTREEKNERVTRSRAKKVGATLIVPCSAPPTKGYSPILPPSSLEDSSAISHFSLDDTDQPNKARRDSGVKTGKPLHERKSSSPRLLLYIGSSPEYNRDAMVARRSRSISLSKAKAEKAPGYYTGSVSERVKLRTSSNSRKELDQKMETLPANPAACNIMRPSGRRRSSAKAPSAPFTPITVVKQKRSSPVEDNEREQKRVKLAVIDLTGSGDDEVEPKPKMSSKTHAKEVTVQQEKPPANHDTSPMSSLTDIDDHEMAHLERSHTTYIHQQNLGSDPNSPHQSNSDSSFVASSPPMPQCSTVATAAGPSTTTTTTTITAAGDYKCIVLNAATWDLRIYATAAKARARCQEHPFPVNHKKNKNRQKRNASLSVGPPIEVGHGMQLYVLDGVHNSVMSALMGHGVSQASQPWGRRMGRQRMLGPEREKMCEWVEAGGFGAQVDSVLGDVEAGTTAIPCLWFKIRETVDRLRRLGAERSVAEEKQEGPNDVEMNDAE